MKQKIPTGIAGFDQLIEGGFPKGRSILISGTPGTGKTIFALQYLYNGATKFNERGLFISFEENSANLKKQAQIFGWDIDQLEKQGKIKILEISPKEVMENTSKNIISLLKKGGYSRLVIDSLSALAINTPSTFTEVTEISVKRFLYHFINELRVTDATALLISHGEDKNITSDRVSEFICDGIIHLKYESLGGEFSRYLTIRKMREIKNDEDIHPLEISKDGIVIHDMR